VISVEGRASCNTSDFHFISQSVLFISAVTDSTGIDEPQAPVLSRVRTSFYHCSPSDSSNSQISTTAKIFQGHTATRRAYGKSCCLLAASVMCLLHI
jgi:hypothetical protein